MRPSGENHQVLLGGLLQSTHRGASPGPVTGAASGAGSSLPHSRRPAHHQVQRVGAAPRPPPRPAGAGAPALRPACEIALRAARDRQCPWRHVAPDHGAAAGRGTVADVDRGHEGVVGAGAGQPADAGAVLGDPVVVGEDRAGADVGPVADLGVADVGQVRHLGAVADGGVLGLHEGADLAEGAQHGPRSQVGERPDRGAVADHRQLALGAHHPGAGPDLAVLERRVRPDHGVLGHHRGAEQLGAGEQRHVVGEHHVGVDPGGRGVHDRHAVAHPAGHDPAVHLPAQLGQLGPVVDALGLHDVVDREGADAQAVLAGDPDHVGQVELTLGVVVGQPRQRADEELGVEGQDPGVDLGDLALVGRGVLLLHDRLDVALAVAHHAAVAERVGHQAAEDADRLLGRPVLGHEVPEALALQQRRVAGGHDHRAVRRTARLDGHPDRAARAIEGLLDRQHGVGDQRPDVRADLLALVADHGHHPVRLEGLHGRQDVPDHAPSADVVQHLDRLGLHPRAAPGREDDDGQLISITHAPRVGVEPTSLVLIQSQAGPAGRPTGECAVRIGLNTRRVSRRLPRNLLNERWH